MHLHPTSKARRLRELLEKQTVVLPGAFNALTAMQIERAGFQALYVSGAGLSATRGLPDIGLLSLTEVVSDAVRLLGIAVRRRFPGLHPQVTKGQRGDRGSFRQRGGTGSGT